MPYSNTSDYTDLIYGYAQLSQLSSIQIPETCYDVLSFLHGIKLH